MIHNCLSIYLPQGDQADKIIIIIIISTIIIIVTIKIVIAGLTGECMLAL